MREKSKSFLAVAMTDEACRGSGGVSLTIFIASVSGSKSLTSFTNRFFDFSGPPGFRLVFDAAKRNERFGRIQCQRSQESSSRGKRKRRVFLCRRTVRVEVKSKVIPTSFLKIKGSGRKLVKEGRLVELVGDQNPNPEALPRSKRGGCRGDVKRGATARVAMRSVGMLGPLRERSEDMTQLNTPSHGVGSPF